MRRDRRLGAHTTSTKRSPFPLSNVIELRTPFFHVPSCLSCAISSGILKVKIGASSRRSVKSSALGHVIFLSSQLSCPLFFPLGILIATAGLTRQLSGLLRHGRGGQIFLLIRYKHGK
jgi:hypothetical protein